jgi:hypothetical protein
MARTPALLILGLVAIAALVVSLVPVMEVTYVEAEPYVANETYFTTETHVEEVTLDYEVVEVSSRNMWWRRSSDCWVTLLNTGNLSGDFRVEFNLVTAAGKETTKVVWQNLPPGKQDQFAVRYYDDFVDDFSFLITPPVVEVITTREVSDSREVVLYNQVEETKKVTVLEYLRKWRGK